MYCSVRRPDVENNAMAIEQGQDADLQLYDDRKKLEHRARLEIRKQTLDPYSRLHSIAEDIAFVNKVHDSYKLYRMLRRFRSRLDFNIED